MTLPEQRRTISQTTHDLLRRNRGRNLHRLKDNTCEDAFSKAWLQMASRDKFVTAHICGKDDIDVEREVDCASVIQWLGSPVGKEFVIGVLEEQGLVTRRKKT